MDTGPKDNARVEMLRGMLEGARDKHELDRLIKFLEDGDIEAATSLLMRNVPAPPPRKPRIPGQLKGRLDIGPEFFEPLTDEEIREIMGE